MKAGQALIEFTKFIANAVVDVAKEVLAALLEAGKLLVDVIKTMAMHAVAAIKKVVEAFFALGKALVTLLKETLTLGMALLKKVVTESYFVFRKIINAVLQALGPVGDILGWLLDRGEALASALWREAVLAIRFVKKSVTEILDWAAEQTQAALERIIQLCEDVGA